MNFNTSNLNNISEEKRALINILNMIYRDNLNAINFYRSANNEIRQSITHIMCDQDRYNNNLNVRGSSINSILNNYLNKNRNNRNNSNNSNNSNSWNTNRTPNRYTVSENNTSTPSRVYSNPNRIYTNGSDFTYFGRTPVIPGVTTDVFEFSVPLTNIVNNSSEDFLNAFFRQFLQPIEVFPTPSQIEIATRIVKYGDILNPLNRECPISLDSFTDDDTVMVIRHCNHIFKQNSLMGWFRGHCVCPVCRYDIRNYTPETGENVAV